MPKFVFTLIKPYINMKKIYLSICAVALSIGAFAQQGFVEQASGIKPKAKATSVQSKKMPAFAPVKNLVVNTTTLQGRFDPSYALPNAHGYSLGTSGAENYMVYVDPVFVDSTTQQSFSASASLLDQHLLGVNFDPKSIIYDQVNFNPLLSNTDTYFLDTVWIGGNYQRRGNNIDDTLIVNISWGDTTNTNWARWAYSAANPVLNNMGVHCTPKFVNGAANGDILRFLGPQTLVIKHVLTKADSTLLETENYLPIIVNGSTGLLIPADNNVNVSYSFNAGGTHNNGDVSYASPATDGVVSAWASYTWYQENPTVAAIADVNDGYDDFAVGKNYSTVVFKAARYNKATGTLNTTTRMGFYWGYWIDLSIHADGTNAVASLAKDGSALGQNVPNPFTGESKVNYSLTKNAKSAVFTVTDVMGRVISTENVDATSGLHTVKLGSYAAGVYYYSLNVDGNVTTKKMIVE